MSIQAMSWVIDHSTTRGSTFTVLLMLANHEGDHDGHVCSWPSIDRLSRQSRVSRRTVINAIEQAESFGELLASRNGGPGGVHIYHVGQMTECRFCTGAIDVLPLHPKRKELGVRGSGVGSASGGSKSAATAAPTRPTEDQAYLAASIRGGWDVAEVGGGRITMAALQKLNSRYGVEIVTSALREVRGFPPKDALRSAYAYVEAICKERAA